MSELSWSTDTAKDLRRPIVVAAFAGYFNAGGAATAAIDFLHDHHEPTELAVVDPETFFDFQQERPQVRLVDGKRIIEWPDTRCFSLGSSGPEGSTGKHDVMTIAGVEPHLRWRTFAEQVVEIGRATGAELFVTLGASPGVVPHTRPIEVVGSATDAELALRLGLGRPSYEGPSGVMGVLHDAIDSAGMPVISLRVSVPHYVMGEPSPKATQALLRKLEQVTGINTAADQLDDATSSWQSMVDAAVINDPEVLSYVGELETTFDAEVGLDPSVDLAAEVETFLRERNEGNTE